MATGLDPVPALHRKDPRAVQGVRCIAWISEIFVCVAVAAASDSSFLQLHGGPCEQLCLKQPS